MESQRLLIHEKIIILAKTYSETKILKNNIKSKTQNIPKTPNPSQNLSSP